MMSLLHIKIDTMFKTKKLPAEERPTIFLTPEDQDDFLKIYTGFNLLKVATIIYLKTPSEENLANVLRYVESE